MTFEWQPLLGWSGLLIGGGLLGAYGYNKLKQKKQAVGIASEHCIGCSFCYHDCPEEAIQMVPRDTLPAPQNMAHASGIPFPSVALVNAAKCTLCGKCLESCEFQAILVPSA
jgi:NAD-dependent dihydropyrimidine dehydrogenase PreA subunit